MKKINSWKLGAALLMAAGSACAAVTSVTWSTNNATRTYTYTRGTAITPDTATIGGALVALPAGCGTTPELPAGLTFTQTTVNQCIISGTPTATSPTTLYQVHFKGAANASDSITFMTITVGPVTNLNYGTKVIAATVGKALTAVTPTITSTGTLTFTADSALPAGLSLSSTTGAISGTPSAAFTGRTYTITAANGTQDTTRTKVNIKVRAAVSYSAWTGHKSITVNTTGQNLGAAVTNFPVLVRLTGANAAVFAATKDGSGVRFTAMDSVSPLPYQIERWDSTAKKAEVWVTLPSVAATGNTTFLMHYGAPTAQTSASAGAATFDTANGFQAVWHMNGAAASVELDATANGYNATPTGTASTTGAIGAARSFDGSSYLQAMNTASSRLNFPLSSAWTIAAWVTSSATQRLSVVTKSNYQYALQTAYSAAQWEVVERLSVFQPGTTTVIRGGWPHAYSPVDSLKGAGVWSHVVGVRKAAGMYVYVNGNLVGDNLPGGAGLAGFNSDNVVAAQQANDVVIGAMFENSTASMTRGWDSNIDDVQMSDVARDSNFIRLSYATQRPTGAVVSVEGTVATVPDAPTGVTGAKGSAAGSIVVTWVAPANDGGSVITGYKVTANDTAKTCTATAPAVTCTITGLTSGTAYTFTVKATNAVGTSAASAASASVTGIVSSARLASNTFAASVRNGAVAFSLPAGVQAGHIVIADMRGRQVWAMNVTNGKASWNGVLANGKPLNNGTYLVRFTGSNAKIWESKLAYVH